MTGSGVIPASEPLTTVVAVAWFSGLWMPDQVRHDGVWGRTGLRAGIHGCGSGVVQWRMAAVLCPAWQKNVIRPSHKHTRSLSTHYSETDYKKKLRGK